MKKSSYIHIYTGDGKGKTTAAIGLAVRALGAGKKVCFLQFMKGKSYSEQTLLTQISRNIELKVIGKPYFVAFKDSITEEELGKLEDGCVVFERGNPPADYLCLAEKGMKEAEKAICSGNYDLVVLDEICCAVYFGLVKEEKLIALLQNRAAYTEVVLTGRNATEGLIAHGDLVTEMREIRHYYGNGVEARRGIEF